MWKHQSTIKGRGIWGMPPRIIFFKSGTLISLLRPCSGQNDTRIFTYSQLVKSLEAIETKLPETTVSQKHFFQSLNAEMWCVLAKWVDQASFIKVAIIRKHVTLNFMHVSPTHILHHGLMSEWCERVYYLWCMWEFSCVILCRLCMWDPNSFGPRYVWFDLPSTS